MDKMTVGGTTLDIEEAITRYKVAKKSADLNERHAAIFEDKFGITEGVMKSYAEVGHNFGISENRARQLCAFVLHKIGLLP
jgi:DNA-directed RNA polymerase sigma subunit (sigma70/sigma32)